MDHVAEIVLPAGTQVVAVSDIPKLIAEALHPPQPEGLYTFKHLTKVVSRSPYLHTPPCDAEELATVSKIAGPPPRDGQLISANELDAYLTGFNTSPQKPGWEIGASVVNDAQSAAIDRLTAEEEQRRELKRAIRSGTFVPLSHALVPLQESIREALDLGRVFVDVFRDYAAKFRILVRVQAAANEANVPLVETSRLLSEITDRILECNLSRWEKPGRNNDIRRDVAQAFLERYLLDQLKTRVSSGAILPRKCDTGADIDGPLDFGFSCDIHWCVTKQHAEQFTFDFSRWPSEIDEAVDSASVVSEERQQRLAAREAEKKAAGRYTLKEAAAELSRATGVQAGRWKKTLMDAARNGELSLRNPQDFSDNLPYAVPKQFYSFAEQVDARGLNAWLNSHPDYTRFRFLVSVPDASSAAALPSGAEAAGRASIVQQHDAQTEPSSVSTKGPRRRERQDPIALAIRQVAVTDDVGFSTYAVWERLLCMAADKTGCLRGSDDGAILWEDRFGQEQKLTFRQLTQRLSRLKANVGE